DPVESFEFDLLDFKIPAIELAKDLYEISKTSGVCCGVVGSWGSGKSSFMKLMDEHVLKEHTGKVHTAWFTAWDPGGAHDLGDAMLHSLFRELVEGNKSCRNPSKNLKKLSECAEVPSRQWVESYKVSRMYYLR
ncbi:MAG: P-loop NTPase fold protein, partial [Candidatus Bathyarchaeota archaeon]|nr:P-loop NTPase fold protein [Candidatus Bathyarchaeota archaeon]